MKKLTLTFIISLLCIIIGLGCKEKKLEISPDLTSSDESLYKLGEKYIKKDPEKARLYFKQVINAFPKSYYAQKAKLAIADSYFHKGDEGNLILAISEYREFISLFPFSPSAAYAQYQIALSFFKKALKPGRDQNKTQQALNEFKKVITNYPLSEEAESARKKSLECEERLAEHILHIGKFYYKAKAYKASTNRLIEILSNYPNYSKMEKVYFYLGDSYYKWNKTDQSVPYFTKLISDYPQSKLAEKAQKRLEEIENKNKENKKQ